MTSQPWKPYSDGTSGHQGEGSEAAEPRRRRLIDRARDALVEAGERGLTWAEFASLYSLHHGQASAALSNLHRTGGAVRLRERREGSGVYVTPGNVRERPTVAYRRNLKRFTADDIADIIEEWREQTGIDRFLTDSEINDLKGRF